MSITSEIQAWRTWQQRNSDGKRSFGDEWMTEESKRIQSPPGFTLTDSELPPGTVRLSDPDDADLGRAVRHVHVWGVEEPE